MIYQYQEKYFRRFFYYGIDEKYKVIEYIIYRAIQKVHDSYGNLNELYESANKKNHNKKQMKKILKEAAKYYKHFYRFVELNDNPLISTYQSKDEEKNIMKNLGAEINSMINDGELEKHKIGYFFTRNKEDGTFVSIEKEAKLENLDIGWPYIVFEFLQKLEKTQQENPELYDLEWLKVKMARAITRRPPHDEELKIMINISNQDLMSKRKKEPKREEEAKRKEDPKREEEPKKGVER